MAVLHQGWAMGPHPVVPSWLGGWGAGFSTENAISRLPQLYTSPHVTERTLKKVLVIVIGVLLHRRHFFCLNGEAVIQLVIIFW